MSLKQFVDTLPDYAKDLRLNASSILNDQTLGEERKNGLLLACAHGSGYKPLVEAVEAEIAGKLSEQYANAARGAAALMAMNNVYYRFVHLVANPEYGTMPAKLRMNLIGSHGIGKEDFELFSIAVSAQNGCGMCMESHERVLLQHGVRSEMIQSAVRIAAVLKAVATVHATLPAAA
jgi:lipoyl-dependent peroxiredoxin subunit D